MAAPFNPYQLWLGIVDPERPPNHYVLLGLPLYESDPETISSAAMCRMAYVLEHDPGQHADWARRLFDELDAARTCLADVEQKSAYDDDLRRRIFLREFGRGANPVAAGPRRSPMAALETATAAQSPDRLAGLKPHEQLLVVPHPALLNDRGSGAYSFPSGQLAAAQDRAPSPVARVNVGVTPKLIAAAVGGTILLAFSAVVGFAWFNREPPEVDPVSPLLAALRQPDPKARVAACQELAILGPKAGAAIPDLVAILRKDDDDRVRLAAVEALAQTGALLADVQRDLADLATREPHPVVKQRLQALSGGTP